MTPAVERAAEAYSEEYQRAIREAPSNRPSRGVARGDAHEAFLLAHRAALTAALTDPDDPDMLARTLYVLHSGLGVIDGLRHWTASPELVRVHWRAIADGLRMILTGSGA